MLKYFTLVKFVGKDMERPLEGQVLMGQDFKTPTTAFYIINIPSTHYNIFLDHYHHGDVLDLHCTSSCASNEQMDFTSTH